MVIAAHEANRRHWDEVTPVHARSRFYDVDAFLAGRCTVGPVERAAVGDLRGKRLLHLQCHFGLDTLSFARLGAAEVTGVDFSDVALSEARRLTERLGLADRAQFVRSDVLELSLDARFDIVFTSHGTIGWLSDLRRWGETIARHLAPDGLFCIVETHPTALLFEPDKADSGRLRLTYGYFHGETPLVDESGPDYAEPGYLPRGPRHYWIWSLADMFGALEQAGLQTFGLREYAFNAWPMFAGMQRGDDGYWHPPEGAPHLPLMFSLKARWP